MYRMRTNARLFCSPGCRATAVAALLAAALGSARLQGQVEDLGGQAQGIVDQMRAQAAYWTPQMQQASAQAGVPAPSTTGGTTITFTPNASAATQRQFLQQEQRIQAIQQRQQMMVAGAQMAGQIAGQLLAQALFGSPNDEQARLAAQARQQQEQLAAEQQRQAQLKRAAQMRIDWDQRDAGMSDELADVFSAPAARSTPAFGIDSSTDPSAMGDPTVPNDGTNFFGSGGQDGQAPGAESIPEVAGDSSPVPSLAPEYVLSQQGGMAPSTAEFSWAHLPEAGPNAPTSQWRQALADKLTGYGIDFAVDKVKGTSAYDRFADALKYVPGYDMAVKAKSAYDYGANLKGQFDALEHPLETVNNRTIAVFENGASGAVEAFSNVRSDGSAFSEDYWQRVQSMGADYNRTTLALIKSRIKIGLSGASKQDEILSGSD